MDTCNCMGLVSNDAIHGPLFILASFYSVKNHCFAYVFYGNFRNVDWHLKLYGPS